MNHREADAFSEDQLQILLALAGHIAVAVENARLFQRERQERQRMLQEADEARAFQRALFDKAVPLGSRFRVRNCKFVTMIYGVLDANSREIMLASAGHPRPLLVNHQCSFLEMDAGLPLGLRVSTYPDYSVKLQPGTHLLLYTDGITEAMDVNYLEYGPERLIGHFLQPDACVEGLMQEIRCFGSQSDLTDDATAMLIRSR